MSKDLEARLDELESREAIRRLTADYGHAFDYEDEELLGTIWHEDARFDLGDPFGEYTGRDTILEAAQRMWAEIPSQHHWMANETIDIDGDVATGVVKLDCFVTSTEGGPAMIGGRYIDRYERRDGVWKFAERRFDMSFYTPMSEWAPIMGSEAPAAAGA